MCTGRAKTIRKVGMGMDELDSMAKNARSDPKIFEELVHRQHKFLIHCAYQATHRYISQAEDEWSETLIAFHDAVQSYDALKGPFEPYVKLVITRRLVDYYRRNKKNSPELLTDPADFTDHVTEEGYNVIKKQIEEKICSQEPTTAAEEIEEIQIKLKEYGFSFWDLTTASPKSSKTRANCKIVIQFILEQPSLLQELRVKKQLPIKIIEKNTGIPPKFLDKYRRYIITAVEILSGEYPKLAEYLTEFRK